VLDLDQQLFHLHYQGLDFVEPPRHMTFTCAGFLASSFFDLAWVGNNDTSSRFINVFITSLS
jgi:hypothetical protein